MPKANLTYGSKDIALALTFFLFGSFVSEGRCIDPISAENASIFARPGEAYDRLHSIRRMDGIEGLVFGIRGRPHAYRFADKEISPMENEFPESTPLSESRTLQNGDIVGNGFQSRTLYIKRVGDADFSSIAGTKGYYWSSFEAGSRSLFVKLTRDGPLLELQNGQLMHSELPYVEGYSPHEFLPWYSRELDGFLIAALSDLWFIKKGEIRWSQINEGVESSYSEEWGFYQQGSREVLSPDGRSLKVISENSHTVAVYSVEAGRPVSLLQVFPGKWLLIPDTGEIVGWSGLQHNYYIEGQSDEEILLHQPRFAVVAPNGTKPELISDLEPTGYFKRAKSVASAFYSWEMAYLQSASAILFEHKGGFSTYRNGSISSQPEISRAVSSVGAKIVYLAGSIFISNDNAVVSIGSDLTIERILSPGPSEDFVNPSFYELDDQSVIFSTTTGEIYMSERGAQFELVVKSNPGPHIVMAAHGDPAAFIAIRNGGSLLLSAGCLPE